MKTQRREELAMVVVTGAAGQLGQAVVQNLIAQGVIVYGCDIAPRPPFFPASIPWICLDLADPPEGFVWPEGTVCVLHLAGSKHDVPFSFDAAHLWLKANLLSTSGALAACSSVVRRFVYVSTISVYSPEASSPLSEEALVGPMTGYGMSKYLGELACRVFEAADSSREVVILRLAQVYGPGTLPENALYRLIQQAIEHRQLRLTCPPTLKRDYLYLTDAADALAIAVTRCPPGVYNVGYGRGVTMGELATAIARSVPGCADPEYTATEGTDRFLSTERFAAATGFAPKVTPADGVGVEVMRLLQVGSQA